ncbi:hypothetical protein SUGI_0582290 [Cryptomeria japonica]|nr:hypothetical protein SUGI_0582290 [Cryptomeria japonica]
MQAIHSVSSASPIRPIKSLTRLRTDGLKPRNAPSVACRRMANIPPVTLGDKFSNFSSDCALKSEVFNGTIEDSESVDKFTNQWAKEFSSDCALKSEVFNGTAEDSESVDNPSSPKQKLGSKWREYAGCNGWNGLLDPLDANLRREIIKYGEFVQATYSACDFDPQSQSYGYCKYQKKSLLSKVGLQNSGCTVTRHVYATSGVQVPPWVSTMLSKRDATWLARQTSWVGFVAVCEDEKEIARLGRRDIVVAFRGTVTPLEWVENLRDIWTPVANARTTCHPSCVDVDCDARVQSGFWNLYTCEDPHGRSVSSDVLGEIQRLLEKFEGEEVSITITGHSLGAALALLTAYQIGGTFKSRNSIPVTVFSFGGPRVGNRAFGEKMDEMGVKVLRVVNTQDVVTKVPGVLERMGQSYCHVGRELRVNNKNSPYLKPDADMACCHDLEAYLHLVDGFLSSSIPFRSTAKRDILRLLVNQKSNVLLTAAKSGYHHNGANFV